MSLKNVDIESAMRRLADRRIEEAMREGKFDNLPGTGKPLDLEPMPADENARMMWWALRLMRNQNFTPDEIRWRKQLDKLRDELNTATTEARVAALVKAINHLVHQINTLGTNALNTAVAPVSFDREREKLAQRVSDRQQTDAAWRMQYEPQRANGTIQCGHVMCEADNPADAKFCRRCGKMLSA